MKSPCISWLNTIKSHFVLGEIPLRFDIPLHFTKITSLTGWWYSYPSENYESVGMITFPIWWEKSKCSKPPTSTGIPAQLTTNNFTSRRMIPFFYRWYVYHSQSWRVYGIDLITWILTGWWFQPLWKIWVNGKDYPIYYGKNNLNTLW